jgi:hypothetical protein
MQFSRVIFLTGSAGVSVGLGETSEGSVEVTSGCGWDSPVIVSGFNSSITKDLALFNKVFRKAGTFIIPLVFV